MKKLLCVIAMIVLSGCMPTDRILLCAQDGSINKRTSTNQVENLYIVKQVCIPNADGSFTVKIK